MDKSARLPEAWNGCPRCRGIDAHLPWNTQVANGLGVAESDICMVVCHFWDTIGAQASGCRAALILRPGNALLPASGAPLPDIVADDLLSFTDEAIRRWRSNTS
jgi:2-haloacid dehalogenase